MNDTVLLRPEADVDVSAFFVNLRHDDYVPTWYARRIDGGLGSNEQAAAEKAATHAETPTVVHFDALGRPSFGSPTTERRSGKYYSTRTELDIQGDQRAAIDTLGRKVITYNYNMLRAKIYQASMDAGERWVLSNAAGKPIRTWDSRDYARRIIYDELHRPVQVFVQTRSGPEVLAENSFYGDHELDAMKLNLRGKLSRHDDGVGNIRNVKFDFKGNLLTSRRQLLQDYQTQVDWSLAPPLETEVFESSTTYDALNRPVS